MDKLVVNPHSLVDVITNSSTMIYTGVKENAVEVVIAIIDDVLKHAGSGLTAEDLYTIEIIEAPDEDDYNTWDEYREAERAFEDSDAQVAGCFNDSSAYLKNKIKITSVNFPDTVVSDRLAEIFFVEEDYG